MIPKLYPSGETAFTDNGLGALIDAQSCEVVETINSTFELSMEYPIAGRNYKDIALNRLIYAPYSPYSDPQPFRIYYISKPHSGVISIKAEHRSYELRYYPCLTKTDYISTAGSASTLMNFLTSEAARTATALNSIAYTFTTNISESKTWAIKNVTDIKAAMMYAAEVFGGEWEYNGSVCTLKARRGQNRGVKVRYNTNLTSFNETKKDYTYSDIMPYWTDGTNYVFLTNPYLPIPASSVTLNKGAKAVNLSSKFDSQPTEQELLAEAINCDEYKNAPKPETSQSVSFIPRGDTMEYQYLYDIDHVELGDDVGVRIESLDIDDTERCCQTMFNVLTDRYKNITLGEVKKGISSTVAQSEEKRDTRWFSLPTAPTNDYQAGDMWFKVDDVTNLNAQSLGQYSGNAWKLLAHFSSGGVGEDLGNGDIRFNDSSNTVTNSNGKNTLFGGSNSMTGCFESIVGGYNNSLTNCNYTWVIGSSNTVEASRAAVFGDENTVNGPSNCGLTCGNNNRVTNGSDDDIVTGVGNTLNNTRRCVVAGMGATYNNSTDSMMIAEGYQTITNLEKCYFVGENNQGAAFNASGARFAYVRDRAFKFKVDYYGNVYAHAYNTASADYAEYFEWSDGNPDEEDRMGIIVQIVGDKIAPAHGDEFIGAISARSSVVGNAYETEWRGRYITDVYGRHQIDEDGHPLISPEYDESREYIPRSKRPEWAIVGLMGRIIVQDNGHCEAGGYISARKGIAVPTYTVTSARMLRRIDKNHIEILIK